MKTRGVRPTAFYFDEAVYFGFGSTHDLREADRGPPPRLWFAKSVPASAAIALSIKSDSESEPEEEATPMGFHKPK